MENKIYDLIVIGAGPAGLRGRISGAPFKPHRIGSHE